MNGAMSVTAVSKPKRDLRLFSDFNNLQFASVMAMIVLVPLLIFMTNTTPHGGISADLPKVLHPVAMPDAGREDAIKVVITRDGRVFVRSDQVMSSADLQRLIKDRLKDPEVEQKVYITADARAHWGTVARVLEGVHQAGILRVAFLADQRRFP